MNQFGLNKRRWGVYYLKNKTSGEQTSLKTHDRAEAERLLQAHNDFGGFTRNSTVRSF